PAGAVNAGHAQDDAVAVEDNFLGLAQNLSVVGIRLGCAFFSYKTSVALRINAGAAGKNDSRVWKTTREMGRAVTIDMEIRIGAGTGAVHDHIGRESVATNGFHIGEVHRAQRDRAFPGRSFGSRPADDL